ncbi:MAG: TorF family putative porin [Pseudomonadota bacterium]|uniref:TorF family putative porin n=1 Tax=Thermithiobacillus tepidarius TaxID=929 RepID=UPI000414E53D|nr:TorF family putative porin [Thermithiobacillus tepidarius]
MRPFNKKIQTLALPTLGAVLLGCALPASAEISGNVGVVSDYIFRGISQNVGRAVAVQGGLSYSHASGLSLSYWGSSVDYGDLPVGGGGGLENDLILGYGGKVGDFGYGLGVIGYLYTGSRSIDDNNTVELNGKLSYGPAVLNVYYALQDAAWTSAGDVYVNLAGSFPLSQDFTLGANAGMYFFNKDDTRFISGRTKSSSFTDATVSLSHPLPVKGSAMSVNYTFGGKDAFGNDLENNAWLGLNLSF